MSLTRRFGFKETREERDQRQAAEKKLKWDKKLEKENLDKLQEELGALNRASFLAPQQKERKRLVERMVKDMSPKDPQTPNTKPVESPAPNNHRISDDDEDDFIGTTTADPELSHGSLSHSFVPRSVKRVGRSTGSGNAISMTAATAEANLLKHSTAGTSDVTAFLDSLL